MAVMSRINSKTVQTTDIHQAVRGEAVPKKTKEKGRIRGEGRESETILRKHVVYLCYHVLSSNCVTKVTWREFETNTCNIMMYMYMYMYMCELTKHRSISAPQHAVKTEHYGIVLI